MLNNSNKLSPDGKGQLDNEDINIPDWWRQNCQEFREHELRPYRPPQFDDGVPTPERIQTLEAEMGVEIMIRSVNPQGEGDWELLVDGDIVTSLDRFRSRAGYTQYKLTSDQFESLVRNAVD